MVCFGIALGSYYKTIWTSFKEFAYNSEKIGCAAESSHGSGMHFCSMLQAKVHKTQQTPAMAAIINPAWVSCYAEDSLIGTTMNVGKNQQSSILSIEIQPWFINQGNKWMQTIPFLLFAKPRFNSYLDSVLKGLDWYINNEMPVPKNHFGVHNWFSKKI